MDVTGAYFSAYVAGKYSCLLKRSGRAFSSAICYSSDSLGAGGVAVAGDDLEAAATWRAKDLGDAVSSLFLFATGKATKQDVGRGVATCVMMIAGAAMSPYVERQMSAGVRSGTPGELASALRRRPSVSPRRLPGSGQRPATGR